MIRRQFLKQSGLLAGGLVLGNELVRALPVNREAGPLTIGIIGCGDRGKGIMSILLEMPDSFNITAIYDVLDFRLQEARKLKPASTASIWKEYTDHRKLLEDRSIQAVVIATPLNMHYEIAANAFAAGKHIYLEKTMTYDIAQALQLVKLARQYPQQIVQVGHQYRYSPLYFRVKDMIAKGYLGKVTQIDCRWDRNWNWRRPVPQPELEKKINWRMYKAYSGGLVAELLSHQIDFINWAFDTHPDEVYGTGGIDYYKD